MPTVMSQGLFAIDPEPFLAPLANNGGPTDTHALEVGSGAIDTVPGGGCVDPQGKPLSTDQRGDERPQGPACDVGSFELLQP